MEDVEGASRRARERDEESVTETFAEEKAVQDESAVGETNAEELQEIFESEIEEETKNLDPHNKIKKRVEWIEDRLRESYLNSCQLPFTSGATHFSSEPSCDGKIRKLLCASESGKIALAFLPEDFEEFYERLENLPETPKVEFSKAHEMRTLWMNIHARGILEVECFEVGEGKRIQDLPNKRGFHLADISSQGYVLGRSGVYAVADDTSDWLPSVVEFHPFTSRLSTIQKATWCKFLAIEEVLVCVSVGDSFVVTCSDAPHSVIRVLSLGGLTLYVASASFGVPISIASCKHTFVILEQTATPGLPWDFRESQIYQKELAISGTKSTNFNIHFDRYARYSHKRYQSTVFIVSRFPLSDNQASFVHIAHRSQLILYGDDAVAFLALSSKDNAPVVATNRGLVFGLMPTSTSPGWLPSDLSQFSETAQLENALSVKDDSNLKIAALKLQSNLYFNFEWVPISDPILKLTRKNIYYYSVDNEAIHVIFYEGSSFRVPMLGESFSNLKSINLRTPLCLPMSTMSQTELPMDIERWYKTPRDEIGSLPWPFLDELRHRQLKQNLCQALWKLSLQNDDYDIERMKTMRKHLEILTLKEAMKLLQENSSDLLSESSKHLAYSSSLDFLIRNAAKKGERLIAEEITNIKQTKDLLKELRQNLLFDHSYARDAFPARPSASCESSIEDTQQAAESSKLMTPRLAQKENEDTQPMSESKMSKQTLEALIQKCVNKKRKMQG
eukprot:Gregarina_sp_Poly_1__9963@NODE_65_length_16489_cov_69_850445_g56_i0_p2_GENE_NODE_65_length_16489_cov_69_850445_g56_i0NODE_65_length_16489_cov_69_850445_g56_i0_p2_ORF_typecomplete_len732_score129_01Mcl1_mid/PF12341_8/1_1e17AKAP2_C/PF15304_6/0_032Med25/PF11232_8/0_31Med25/PF11232_8/1_5e03SF3a60_bindingd/PF12108_8/0_43_NODE_65_length_16489_cov_69_850445_g56_i01314615341